MSSDQVEVVVLTWNDATLARHAVASVLASEGVDARALVVDNGSVEPFVWEGAHAERVRVHRSAANLGVAGGRNAGVAVSSSEWLCVLDSDARLEPGCLAALFEALRSDDRVGMSAPVYVGQSPEESAGRAPTALRKLARGVGFTRLYKAVPHGGPWWDVEFAMGACQFFRRRAFVDVGGMDDTWMYGLEDLDFCRRLQSKEWRIVQVGGAACHHAPQPHGRRMLSKRGLRHGVDVARYLLARRRVDR